MLDHRTRDRAPLPFAHSQTLTTPLLRARHPFGAPLAASHKGYSRKTSGHASCLMASGLERRGVVWCGRNHFLSWWLQPSVIGGPWWHLWSFSSRTMNHTLQQGPWISHRICSMTPRCRHDQAATMGSISFIQSAPWPCSPPKQAELHRSPSDRVRWERGLGRLGGSGFHAAAGTAMRGPGCEMAAPSSCPLGRSQVPLKVLSAAQRTLSLEAATLQHQAHIPVARFIAATLIEGPVPGSDV